MENKNILLLASLYNIKGIILLVTTLQHKPIKRTINASNNRFATLLSADSKQIHFVITPTLGIKIIFTDVTFLVTLLLLCHKMLSSCFRTDLSSFVTVERPSSLQFALRRIQKECSEDFRMLRRKPAFGILTSLLGGLC